MGRRAAPQIETQLSLRAGAQGAPFRERWMDLLASLESQPSISAAARAVGLSYKAAWDAIATMNNLSGAVLVERSVGGKGGGGAALTPKGRELVATFRTVREESRRFVARVNERVGRSEDLATLGRMTLITSARNHFAGRVVRIRRGAVNDEVELALAGGERLFSTITRQSTQTLGLKKGVQAVALIKASWVSLDTDPPGAADRNAEPINRLRGTVGRITPDAIRAEVLVELGSGASLVAVVPRAQAEALDLRPGQPVQALFEPSSVILGVAG